MTWLGFLLALGLLLALLRVGTELEAERRRRKRVEALLADSVDAINNNRWHLWTAERDKLLADQPKDSDG